MNRSDLHPIEDRVQKSLVEHFPDSTRRKFILGVSGGPDSMCLLYLFKKMTIDALVVHINYGKRGRESDKDAELVEQIAFQWEFDCHSLRVDSGDSEDENFQQWAREVRYDIFRSLAKEHDVAGIALAHHQDDQIETILQKQFRGAGIGSWSAMSVWDGELFRPLLHTTRKEIEAYVKQESIPYRTDASNLQSDFARNFLRNEWLKDLEQHFPGWRQNVLRIAEQGALFEEAVEWIAGRITDGPRNINRKELLDISPRLRKAIVLLQLKNLNPDVQISGPALDELDHLPELQTGKTIQLTKKLWLMRDRDYFRFTGAESDPLHPIKFERKQLATGPLEVNGIIMELTACTDRDYSRFLYLDSDKIQWPLTVRPWQKGDRFQPFGMEGHQNVSDHLANRKISAVLKDQALVLESFEETICAVIFPPTENRVPPGTISELVRCDEATQSCLTIKRRV